MTEAKTYLNVPYAQKDAAKALGARWDATQKKWYVPAEKDIALFAQWQTEALASKPAAPISKPKSPPTAAAAQSPVTGVFTYPADKNFVPYSGVEPPWD